MEHLLKYSMQYICRYARSALGKITSNMNIPDELHLRLIVLQFC